MLSAEFIPPIYENAVLKVAFLGFYGFAVLNVSPFYSINAAQAALKKSSRIIF
jgi:hypothetical protein